jgi:deoxyribodipyrimidine photo-lyase
MKSQFSRWKWDNKPAYFEAWKRGETGYPIVDAGMRQMYYTGFMHNRVRMIVASFLVKDLNIAWQKGAEWFFERLLDADLANNSFNWQWSAGTGPDAQPFFRIFNPELQSAKFDPQGLYIRHWVPELEKAPTSVLHAPWKAKPAELAAGSIVLGKTYPHVIVDHDVMKKKALEEFHRVGL